MSYLEMNSNINLCYLKMFLEGKRFLLELDDINIFKWLNQITIEIYPFAQMMRLCYFKMLHLPFLCNMLHSYASLFHRVFPKKRKKEKEGWLCLFFIDCTVLPTSNVTANQNQCHIEMKSIFLEIIEKI